MARTLSIAANALDELADELASLFPSSEFEKIIQGYRPEATRGLEEYALARAKAHPLAIAWHKLLSEIEQTKSVKQFKFTKDTYFFIDTLSYLLDQKIGNMDRIIDNIMNSSQFYSGLFEAHVAASYAQRGYHVSAIRERSDEGIKTPDLEIRKDNQFLYVECKSLENKERKEYYLWDGLLSKILKNLNSLEWCWDIHIESKRPLKIDEISIIDSEIYLITKRNRSFYMAEVIQGFFVSGKRIARRDISYITPFVFRRGAHARLECDVLRTEDGGTHYKNPTKISANKFIDIALRDRVENVLYTANKQFKHYTPGVVHIEIPFRDGKNIIDSTTPMFNRIFRNLSKHKRISAVALHGRVINPHPKEGENIILNFDEIIPNPSAFEVVAECFWLMGADDPLGIASQLAEEGMVVVEFELSEPFKSQESRTLLAASLHDSARRFRLWWTPANNLRIDAVDKRYGLKFVDLDASILREGGLNKLAASYSDRGIAVSVNGSEVMTGEQEPKGTQ